MKKIIFLTVLLGKTILISSQTPFLVKDINPGGQPSYITNLTKVNNTLFFAAFDLTHGLELWKTNGTHSGTVLVKDINVGPNNSAPSRLTNVNGTLFFRADDGINGPELWKSDGTETGTMMVKNIRPSTLNDGISHIAELTSVGNLLFFAANDGVNDYALWKSDGTETGTVMVKDINPTTQLTSLGRFIDIDGTLFFGAFDGVNGHELWKSDGTETGTVMVKNIAAGIQDGFTAYPFMTNVNGTLFFVANDGKYLHERELWKSDGTEAGTTMVKDIYPGDNGFTANSSVPWDLKNVNGTLFFQAQDGIHGSELWKSDGTEFGTELVKDIKSGIFSSSPNLLSNCNGTLYFRAVDSSGIIDVWKSDGTETGTILLKNPSTGHFYSEPAEFTYLNGYVYFVATGNTIGRELFRTDGTSEGTIGYNLRYLTESSSPEYLTIVGNTLFFIADNGANGNELWALETQSLDINDNKLTKSNLSIYPNPSNGFINIKNESNITIEKLIVYSITGKHIIEQNNVSNGINIAHLKNGLYFIRIQSSNETFTYKFVKI
ncbi:ELWxxDGT repeat protein [Mariniflexile aquimaris]|uniref:ELWxxDGT repeat protein n=1 Tax=Mariniflexile aquimaris TaxID=881009 RepID=A0ABW3BXX5_9FLAO